MVFEQLFRLRWIERKEHAFFLAFIYSVIGLVSANLIFPANAGLMSIAFTSILLIPSLTTLLKLEENMEISEKKLSASRLFKDHKDIFKIYLFMFLGIFFAYLLASLILPEMAIQKIFAEQLRSAGIRGFAAENGFLFKLLMNNMLVFITCFILSFIYGAGSVLFLTWNASVWGVVIALFAKESAILAQTNKFAEFTNSIMPFLPHMITEATAYISAAIVGGVISKAVLREKIFSKKFHHIITDALILLVVGFMLVIIAGIIEVNIF